MHIRYFFLIALLVLVLTGCGPSNAAGEEIPPSDPQLPPGETLEIQPPDSSVESPSTQEPTNAPPVEKFVDLAKNDLVSRLQIDIASVNLVKSEEVIWPDAALGCPEPGKTYAQARVPGFRIWLEAGGLEYDYHSDWDRQVILCAVPGLDGNSSLPVDTGPTPQIGVPIK